jgi:phospholipid/cholesterol/gamma-HCH transport system permease protein
MSALELQREGENWRLRMEGDWSLSGLAQIERDLALLPGQLSGILLCDWSQARRIGLGTVWALLGRIAAAADTAHLEVRHVGNPPPTVPLLQRLIDEQRKAAALVHDAPVPEEGAVAHIGRWTVNEGIQAREVLGFLGRLTAVIGQAFRRPRALRISSLGRHIYEAGVTAIPIVSLIAFLISVVVAYLGAEQLARFGADIFVVDLVTIGVLREMGVLLTAIVIAGRSGSAFAAEIGVMRLNEETDALRAMGLNPIELLVVPRVLGLVIALPLLTVIADAMGLAGGGLLSLVQLHIPPAQFTVRMREALSPTTFWSGLLKAPVFALLIGMVGTYRGMQVKDSARELGRLTTTAVVQSIFLVILADALFAILFQKMDF